MSTTNNSTPNATPTPATSEPLNATLNANVTSNAPLTTTRDTCEIVQAFIGSIWNAAETDRIDSFLHPDFVDHSLPEGFSPDKQGLLQWVAATGRSFQHRTLIREQVTEGDTSIIKIEMQLTHIGPWRGLAPTRKVVSATGYRCFRVQDGRIIAHWALIDGNALENQLKETDHGCKVQP